MSARLTIPSPNHRENGETKKILGSPNGEFGDDQTLEIVDTEGAAEESKLNGVPEFPMGTKPKIILHRQVGRLIRKARINLGTFSQNVLLHPMLSHSLIDS